MVNPKVGKRDNDACPDLGSGEPSGKARARSSRARSRRAGNPGGPEGDALDGAGSPGLVLVREPDQLGLERAHPQLAFGVRLIELAEPNRHVAARQPDTRQSR